MRVYICVLLATCAVCVCVYILCMKYGVIKSIQTYKAYKYNIVLSKVYKKANHTYKAHTRKLWHTWRQTSGIWRQILAYQLRARARAHTHTHTHIYIYIFTHTHTHTYIYIHTYTQRMGADKSYTQAGKHTQKYDMTHPYMYVCMYVCIYMQLKYVYICNVFVCIHIRSTYLSHREWKRAYIRRLMRTHYPCR